jgi:RNA polymerase sigma factor (sigma-70 family)
MNEPQFLELIEKHQAIIHKICRLYRESSEDREDLFQEVVFQLWKSKDSFQEKAKFSTWMYRIALNTAMASFRKKKLPVVYTGSVPDLAEQNNTEQRQIQEDQLFHALQQLDDSEKAIIALYLEDMSYQEIASITGISENYVGVKLNRIKTKIQKLLK